MNANIPEDIINKFEGKYDWLKSEQFPSIGKPFENGVYQNPDGGWQQWFENWATIALRPGETDPHEVHGAICARWAQEGGAWNEKCERGWLGYPISDEEVYDGEGDSDDRISHFENGDIIWTAKTNGTRIIKKMSNISALSAKRREIIKPLEGLRDFVKRPNNGLTESRVKEMEKNIDSAERSICYDRYRVTVFGAFSSGKSTLLNALMGTDYLPSADLPTTNITTEIFRADRFYLFVPGDIPDVQLKALCNEVSKEVSGGKFLKNIERDGQMFSGAGVSFQPGDSQGFRQALGQLASEQSRHEKGFSTFKTLIKDGHSPVLQLGIPNLPEWLGEITLTDAPGAGSVYKGHESIIDDIIPKTQLVLYVVESTKAGSSVVEWLCKRIVNSFRRKVFFVLNKIDQQNNDEITDALAELKEHIPSIKAGNDGEPAPPKPEFLRTSALCEVIANQLSDGSATIKDLITNKKLSISELLVSGEWASAGNEEERKIAAIRFLREQSQFDKIRVRIQSYLHEENKELPFCERAEVLVKTFGQELDGVNKAGIAALKTDRSDKALEEQQQDLRRLRERSANEAKCALKDFRESALNPESGILSKVEKKLIEIPNVIATKLERVLTDNGEFKRLTENKGKALQNWLTREASDQMEPVTRSLDGELRRQGAHLVERLRPILAKIDDATLVHQWNNVVKGIAHSPETNTRIGKDADGNLTMTTVAAGVSGGALVAVLGLTVGVVTSSTTIAGTGLAGVLGSGVLGSLAASVGLGTTATTIYSSAPFWGLGLGPVVAIIIPVVVALGIIGRLLARNIIRKRIVETVRSELKKQIVGDANSSVIGKLKKKVDAFVNESVDSYNDNLNAYLNNLDKQEKKIIADVAKAKDDKEGKIKELEAFREEVKAFVESSVQTLRELNPGKESVHG